MSESDRTRWNTRYATGDAPVRGVPNRWLAAQAAHVDAWLARSATAPHALDLACGAGDTLVWLARRGWQVTGVDVSDTATALAWQQFVAAGLAAQATIVQADLDAWRPPADSFDMITCFYFLDRRLWPDIRTALRPGGLLCMQTYHTGQLAVRPQTDPAHLLAPGELSALLADWGWQILAAATTETQEAVLGLKAAA